jgi:hypothetical protein
MTTPVTWHSGIPRGPVADAAVVENDSVCIGGESQGCNQGEGCEDSIEVHSDLTAELGFWRPFLNCSSWKCKCW